jgi:hypothetical protein
MGGCVAARIALNGRQNRSLTAGGLPGLRGIIEFPAAMREHAVPPSRRLKRDGWPNYTFAIHDGDEIGPGLLANFQEDGIAAGGFVVDPEHLRDAIRSAFPPSPFYGRVTDCECEECSGIARTLAGKSWDEVPAEFIDSTCSPVLLTPAAFQAFVAAWLVRSLDFPDRRSAVVEFTVYSLCPPDPDDGGSAERVRALAALMDSRRVAAIRDFLSFVRRTEGEWIEEFVVRALDSVWIA